MHSAHRGHADLSWLPTSHHVCHFFHTATDVSEVLVPYFKTGLERGEACLWITGDHYGAERANSEMRAVLSDFDRQVAAGQIQIVSEAEWYARYGSMSTAESVQHLLSRKDQAIVGGRAGLRISGHFSSLHEGRWDDFLAYERIADEAFKGQPIAALCSYSASRCSGNAVLDVMQRHEFGLCKRRGHWRPIETWSRTPRPPHAVQGRWPADLSRSLSMKETDMIDIVEEQLGVCMLAYPERIALNGGHVALQVAVADRLRRGLHELVDNAMKHGAFAAPHGRLAVTWHLTMNGSRRLHVEWTEHGMSGLAIPETVGLGTHIIAAAVENCTRSYRPDGAGWKFELGV
jgi:DcmR-like sensory protein